MVMDLPSKMAWIWMKQWQLMQLCLNTDRIKCFRIGSFLPLDEAVASRAVFAIVSGSDGRAAGNAFGAS